MAWKRQDFQFFVIQTLLADISLICDSNLLQSVDFQMYFIPKCGIFTTKKSQNLSYDTKNQPLQNLMLNMHQPIINKRKVI